MEQNPQFPVAYQEPTFNKGGYLFGIIIFGFGALFLFSVIVSMMFDSEKQADTGLIVFGFLVCTGIPLTISLLMLKTYRRKLKKRQDDKNLWIDHSLIRLANTLNGRVSIPDVMTNLQITIEEAKASADRLVQKGALEVLVTPSGSVVYQLSGYDKEKAEYI